MAVKKKKKGRLLKPHKLKSAVLKYFLNNPKKRMNAGSLAKKLKVANTKDSFRSALKALLSEEKIRSVAEGKYVLKKGTSKKDSGVQSKKKYIGIVDSIKSGAAYIIVDNLEKDVYVPARHLSNAFNGDEVEVGVRMFKHKNPEGKVKRIVKRNTPQVIGRLSMVKKYGVVNVSSKKVNIDVSIKKNGFNGAKDDDLVVVDIIDWGNQENPTIWGSVNKILTDLGEHDTAMETILVENGFSSTYPEAVMKEVSKYTDEISEEEIAKRRDFRDVLTFTIDPDTAQDFDDALSFGPRQRSI